MIKMKPTRGRKTNKPQVEPRYVNSRDIKTVRVKLAMYNERCEPVCPECGSQNFKCLDYSSVSPEEGIEFINLCKTCNTIFKYTSKVVW